jgi:hypothetical protein
MSAEFPRERQVSKSLVVSAQTTTSNYTVGRSNRTGVYAGLSFGSSTFDGLGYPVTGVVGRCFMRVCLWVDLMTSWSRRKNYFPPSVEGSMTSGKRV